MAGLWLLAAVLGVAFAANRFGFPHRAAELALGALLLFSAVMAWQARDGFRSVNLFLPLGLLTIAALVLSPTRYCVFALLCLALTGALGYKEMQFVAHGGKMYRSKTSFQLIVNVECIFGVTAVAGGVLASSMQRNLRRIQAAARELNQVNAALTLSEDRWRSLFELAADAIYVTDSVGRIVDANRRACALGGVGRDRLPGLPITEAIPFERPCGHPLTLDRLKKGVATPIGAELRTPGGSSVPVELTAQPMPDGTLQVICRDVTDRLKAEEKMLHMQKIESIGRLAGGVAHDFNNLLTVINGYCNLLLKTTEEGGRSHEFLVEIANAGSRATALTQQLLAFSRKQVIQPRVLDLNAEIAGSVKMLRNLLGANIKLTTSLDPEICQVLADSGQICQVLINLAVNARDAMPNGGELLIRTQNAILEAAQVRVDGAPPGRWVKLTVADNGAGMDEATRVRIFEPFFTTKQIGVGTGLGLSTVDEIVRQCRGWIAVESAPGRGATFEICLPAADRTAHAEEEAAPVGRLKGSETVLVVEDQPEVREFARCVLRGFGYRVLEAGGVDEAVRLLQSAGEPIDLLLSDVVMPGTTGEDIVQKWQSMAPGMKVLYMSGCTDGDMVRHGVLRDGLNFIAKPFSPDGLAAKVRQVLDEG